MGTTTSRIDDPVREAATRVAPGTTTRDDLRRILGLPLWTSARWRAELYSGEAVLQVWHYDPFFFPYRSSERQEPATLLVVFGPDDVVVGTAYSGPGCGRCGPEGKWGAFKSDPCPGTRHACIEGDLQGLEIQDYQLLLAPATASRGLMEEAPPSGRCALMVAQSDKVLGGFDLYLDERFIQRFPRTASAAFVRVDTNAGQHALMCTDWSGRTGPEIFAPVVPEHEWPGGKPRHGHSLVIDCPADGRVLYRLVNTGGDGVWRAPACGIVPIDSTTFPAGPSEPRLVIIADRPN